MPEIERVEPSTLPADTLISFPQFSHHLQGVTQTCFARASKRGTAPAGVRLTNGTPRLYRAGDVASYIADRMAPLAAADAAEAATGSRPKDRLAAIEASIVAILRRLNTVEIDVGGKAASSDLRMLRHTLTDGLAGKASNADVNALTSRLTVLDGGR